MGNLKIYSGNIYGFRLLRQNLLVEDRPVEYLIIPFGQVSTMTEEMYNYEYFVSRKRIFNRAFFIVNEHGSIIEAVTGYSFGNYYRLENTDEFFSIEDFFNNNANINTLVVGDLHEELDTTRIERYLEERDLNIKEIKEKINQAIDERIGIINFYKKQQIYKKNNSDKIKKLALQIKNSRE